MTRPPTSESGLAHTFWTTLKVACIIALWLGVVFLALLFIPPLVLS